MENNYDSDAIIEKCFDFDDTIAVLLKIK